MKDQALRKYRESLAETAEGDMEQLKERTAIALNKLGHQKFLDEPGSYSLENWMKGVKILLDDFEEKMGTKRLTAEYLEKRRELTERLSMPVDVSAIEKDTQELKQSEEELVRRFAEERARTASKIGELEGELARKSTELEKEKKRLSSAIVVQNHRSSLSRLFRGRSAPAVVVSEDRVEELESKIRELHDEAVEQQRRLRSIDLHAGPPWAGEWARLESMRAKMKELNDERLAKVQHVMDREETTTSIANAISEISANDTEDDALSPQG